MIAFGIYENIRKAENLNDPRNNPRTNRFQNKPYFILYDDILGLTSDIRYVDLTVPIYDFGYIFITSASSISSTNICWVWGSTHFLFIKT